MAPVDGPSTSIGVPAPTSAVMVGAGELWMPYREIQEIIERVVLEPTPENISDVENVLRAHKPDFVSLLSAKPKSPADREELKKGAVDGIYLRGHEGKKVLQQAIVQEALLLSDIFDVNEFQALDLLTTAESELEYNPGWTRGLLAVHMFYEGRAAMIASFVSLLQAIPGNTWSSRVNKKVLEVFETFVSQVFQEDMVDRIVSLLSKHKTKVQVETLDANLALGDWRHRESVLKFIDKIREGLGQIVFCWAAQRGLKWKDSLRVLEYLKTRLNINEESFEMEKDDVLLITSLMYSVDNANSSPNIDKKYALELKKYCTENSFVNGYTCVELLDLLKLVYYSSTYKLINEAHSSSIGTPSNRDVSLAEIAEEDDFEMQKDVFAFLRNYILTKSSLFSEEEHVMRRYHAFFADFITFMPSKVKDLKNKCEDAAKTIQLYNEQGLVPPTNLPKDYENFLECMFLFYSQDHLGLSDDYFSSEIQHSYLNKLVRSTTMDQPFMFVNNVKMLMGLGKGCPIGVFNLLKQNGHYLSLEHFFESITKYLGSFGGQVAFNGPTVYASDTYQRVITDSMKFAVNPSEVLGICTYLDMIEALCENSPSVQHYFTTARSHWLKTLINSAKVRSIPREIRARMLNAAAAMIAKDSIGQDGALNLWETFYNTKLIDFGSGDLRDELEDREARLESYSLTIGLLKLLSSLIDARFGIKDEAPIEVNLNSQLDNGVLQPYVAFVRDSVLLKVGYRSYKAVSERWQLATLAMGIISKLLDYVPSLMIQMLSDTPMHRMVLGALLDCVRLKEMSSDWGDEINQCSLQCLNLLRRTLRRQSSYLYRRDLQTGKHGSVIVGIHQLIMKVVHDTGKPEYLLSVVKFIDHLQSETHRNAALEILEMIIEGHGETDSHVYTAVVAETNTAMIIRLALSELLDDINTTPKMKTLVLQLLRASIVHSSPNLALYLLGADKKTDFQNPGMQGYPRTVLHALLDNATVIPEGFQTLLVLMRDARISGSLLRYLRTNQYFVKILTKELSVADLSHLSLGYFLKCVALELYHTKQPGPLLHTLIGPESGKFQGILEHIELQLQSLDVPNLEFFDTTLVMEAMKTCEVQDRELNTKIIRVEALEALLRDEIEKLEKTNVLKLKKSIHLEAKELINFAIELSAARQREASKVLVFDGWKQCLETMLLNPNGLRFAGADFVSGMLRLILDKVRSTSSPSEYFLRLAAEASLTLCSLLQKLKADVKGPTLSVILTHFCSWVPNEQHALVRTYIYSSIHHILDMLREIEGTTSVQASFAQIVDHLCRDVSQNSDFGRLQAMYLIGEIIRATHSKNLGGFELSNSSLHGSPRTPVSASKIIPEGSSLLPGTPRSFIAVPSANTSILTKSRVLNQPESDRTQDNIFMRSPVTCKTPSGRKFYSTTMGPSSSKLIDFNTSARVLSPSINQSVFSPGFCDSFGDRVEAGGENRCKSLLDCTSQELFDPSYGGRGDMGTGRTPTTQKLSLSSATPMKKALENLSLKSSSQSLLINHLYNKGYLRGLVDALPLVDDTLLMQLFSDKPEPAHMRALLLFEAKMSLFSRFAWSGQLPTQYLIDVNIILRLADMTVFDINFLDQQDTTVATREEFGLTMAELARGPIAVPNRKERVEILFRNVTKLFLAMVTAAPRNVTIVDQIWHFITTHDCALATLIDSSVIRQDERSSSAYIFTSLMAQIARKLPVDSFKVVRNRATVYTRLIGILKIQEQDGVYSENRMVLVRNAVLFLYNHALNTEALKVDLVKRLGLSCRPVLTRQVVISHARGNADFEVPIGLILYLARDSLHRIQTLSGNANQRLIDCHEIVVQVGLSLTLRHAEIFVNEEIMSAWEGEPVESGRFKKELAQRLDEYFPNDGTPAEESRTFADMMLHRLRLLAHSS